MVSSSLFRFAAAGASEGLSFNRAEVDGLPYRGRPLLLKEAEAEQGLITAKYTRARWFDTHNARDMSEFGDIYDRILANWYQLVFWAPLTDPDRKKIFMIWVQRYKEPSPQLLQKLGLPPPIPSGLLPSDPQDPLGPGLDAGFAMPPSG